MVMKLQLKEFFENCPTPPKMKHEIRHVVLVE